MTTLSPRPIRVRELLDGVEGMTMNTSADTMESQTWVAFGPAGAIGSVSRVEGGFTFRLLSDDATRATYPSLGIAKSALFAALDPGSDWPEFREH